MKKKRKPRKLKQPTLNPDTVEDILISREMFNKLANERIELLEEKRRLKARSVDKRLSIQRVASLINVISSSAQFIHGLRISMMLQGKTIPEVADLHQELKNWQISLLDLMNKEEEESYL